MGKISAKKVSMLELFYDLVFVYAISKITAMIHHPHHGGIEILTYTQFTLVVVIVIQVWLYQALYINRFGEARIIDHAGILVTMFAMIYLANNINTEWDKTFVSFQIAMLLILVNLSVQYFLGVRQRREPEVTTFLVVLVLESILVACGLYLGYEQGIYYVATGYLIGFLLPLVMYPKFSVQNVNFPHLVERLNLIAIITFGETVVNIASYFKGNILSPTSILVFLLVISLFGSYTLQIEKLMDHHQRTKAFVLMYSHVLLILSLLSLTVALLFITEPSVSREFLFGFVSLGALFFYVALFSNSVYNKKRYRLRIKDILCMSTIFIFIVSLLYWQRESELGFLAVCALLSMAEYAYTLWRKHQIEN